MSKCLKKSSARTPEHSSVATANWFRIAPRFAFHQIPFRRLLSSLCRIAKKDIGSATRRVCSIFRSSTPRSTKDGTSDCKDPMMRADWTAAWGSQGRLPSFFSDVEKGTQDSLGKGLALYGTDSLPTIIVLSSNFRDLVVGGATHLPLISSTFH
jgi:hypothetical protein